MAVPPGSAAAWILDVVRHHRLDTAHGFAVEIRPIANRPMAHAALVDGQVDIIVEDWFWVSGRRARDDYVTFVPILSAPGALMASEGSPELRGSVGVTSGAADAERLLLLATAYYRSPTIGNKRADLHRAERSARAIVAWQEAARLEVQGQKRMLDLGDAALALGARGAMPQSGFVFYEDWPRRNQSAAIGFVRATRAAKQILMTSDAEWERLRPLVADGDARLFNLFRDRFRSGFADRRISDILADAEDLHRVLGPLAGDRTDPFVEAIAPGTFWRGHPDNP